MGLWTQCRPEVGVSEPLHQSRDLETDARGYTIAFACSMRDVPGPGAS